MDDDMRFRQAFTVSADHFRFDYDRLDASELQRAGRRRRRVRRTSVGALALVIAGVAGVAAADRWSHESSTQVAAAPADVYLVPSSLPDSFVLRRATTIDPSVAGSAVTVFYSDGSTRRIAVTTVARDGFASDQTPPAPVATGSGFWMSWAPRPGIEVDVATTGLTQEATAALFSDIGEDQVLGPNTYGLLSLSDGLERIGQTSGSTRSGSVNVYAEPAADLDAATSLDPRADVTIGTATELAGEMDRIVYDERSIVTIRGHRAEVTTHDPVDGRGSIVTVSWFETPGVMVYVTTYNWSAEQAVQFAGELAPATAEAWDAHRSAANG